MEITNIELNKKYKLKELIELHNNITGATLEYKKQTNCIKSLLKELGVYYKLQESGKGKGKGYMITEKYEAPLSKIDGRKTGNTGLSEGSRGNNVGGIYTELLQPLLKNYINYSRIQYKQNILYTTNNQLGKHCGFITDNFIAGRDNTNILCRILKEESKLVNNKAIYNVIKKINNSYKSSIQYNLSKLQQLGNIKYCYGFIIIWDYIIDKNDKNTKKQELRLVDEEEIKIINEIENELLKKFKLESMSDIYFNKKITSLFYKEFEGLCQKRIGKCTSIFKGYKIEIIEEFEYEDVDIRKTTIKINNTFKNKIYDNLKIDIDKNNPDLNVYLNDYTIAIESLLELNGRNVEWEINKRKIKIAKIMSKKNEQKIKNNKDAQMLIDMGIVKIKDIT